MSDFIALENETGVVRGYNWTRVSSVEYFPGRAAVKGNDETAREALLPTITLSLDTGSEFTHSGKVAAIIFDEFKRRAAWFTFSQ